LTNVRIQKIKKKKKDKSSALKKNLGMGRNIMAWRHAMLSIQKSSLIIKKKK